MRRPQTYGWPGNIRELRNAVGAPCSGRGPELALGIFRSLQALVADGRRRAAGRRSISNNSTFSGCQALERSG
jgi:transcriptional regulator with PAS, ATPase and Fis domain